MTLSLPIVLQRYFEAQNAHDIEAMVDCFTPDAVVRDEGRNITSPEGIRAWMKDTSAKYRIAAEPIESRVETGLTVVVAKVSGNFPGSPANLTYLFGLAADGRISALEVR
jgi:ketosteroid isomerase-like protein